MNVSARQRGTQAVLPGSELAGSGDDRRRQRTSHRVDHRADGTVLPSAALLAGVELPSRDHSEHSHTATANAVLRVENP